MNKGVLEDTSRQTKSDTKMNWAKLTDYDISQINRNAERLEEFLQERYGYSREQAKREVETHVHPYR